MRVLGKNHAEKAKTSLLSLEQNISTSKSNVSRMISAAVEALCDARNERESARSSHCSLLDDWREASFVNSDDIESASREQENNMSTATSNFKNGMKVYSNIDKSLAGQRHAGEDMRYHINQVKLQETSIVEQKEKMLAFNERRIRSQKVFMSNVLKNIGEIMQTQMDMFSREAQEAQETFKTTNEKLLSTNENLNSQAEDIAHKVDQTNSSLYHDVTLLRKDCEMTANVMEDTISVLNNISKSSAEHHSLVQRYATKADDHMSKFSALDSTNDKLLERIKEDGQSCITHMTEKVLETSVSDINSLSETGEKMMSHCSNVLSDDVKATLTRIMEDQEKVSQEIQNSAQETILQLATGEQNVMGIADVLCQHGEKSALLVSGKNIDFNNRLLKRRQEQIESVQDKVKLCVDKLSDLTSFTVTNTSVQTKSVKSQFEGYNNVVIQSNKEVPPVEERKIINFSEILSGTPSEKEILQSATLLNGSSQNGFGHVHIS